MNSAILSMLILGGAGLVSAVILYFVAKKFAVKEDERIAIVEAILPGANCGACGRKGCHDFAVACCEAETLDGLHCPSGGTRVMPEIAKVLGLEADQGMVLKAFIRCNGSACNRLVKRDMSAARSCRLAKTLAYPAGYCTWGCLGCGDCVDACKFGAMTFDKEKGLPRVNLDLCTGCNACAKACPQGIITMRKEDEFATVIVSCSNRAKGAAARKMCTVACIGCGKCAKNCPTSAITISENLATIDESICISCGKCAEGCPTQAIGVYGEVKPLETTTE